MFAWRCKGCKGPAIAGGAHEKPWLGPCPHCGRYRDAERVSVSEEDVPDAQLQPIKEGEVISLADAIAQSKNNPALQAIATGSPGVDWVLGGGIPVGLRRRRAPANRPS
jgi:predicted ATP-dependent serine protease